MSHKPSAALLRAARRAAANPFFLASIFEEYQRSNQIDDAAVAGMLGCGLEDLPRLALCRRPQANPSAFVEDIAHLTRRFGLRPDQLALIVRHVDTLRAMRHHSRAAQPAPRMLRAARDRDEQEPPDAETADE